MCRIQAATGSSHKSSEHNNGVKKAGVRNKHGNCPCFVTCACLAMVGVCSRLFQQFVVRTPRTAPQPQACGCCLTILSPVRCDPLADLCYDMGMLSTNIFTYKDLLTVLKEFGLPCGTEITDYPTNDGKIARLWAKAAEASGERFSGRDGKVWNYREITRVEAAFLWESRLWGRPARHSLSPFCFSSVTHHRRLWR